jgi:MoxR-like ATPase
MESADRDLLERLARRVVGRRRELEIVVAALAAGRHVLLEGPPGTGSPPLASWATSTRPG